MFAFHGFTPASLGARVFFRYWAREDACLTGFFGKIVQSRETKLLDAVGGFVAKGSP
jgi:hypothetical protein